MPTAWFWDVGDLLRTASTPAEDDDPTDAPRRSRDERGDPRRIPRRRGGGRSRQRRARALEMAGAIVTYEQALRFLTDWIAATSTTAHRPEQNLDRARAQLTLLASMPGTVGS